MTRYVVVGAGAVGGVAGAQLASAGHDVTFVARGPHLHAIRGGGLIVQTPDGETTHRIRAVGSVADAAVDGSTVVVLAVKSNDTDGVLRDLAAVAPASTHVVCLQNGVDNERRALRLFEHVHAAAVIVPAAHLDPGIVVAYSSPTVGLVDVGRYPWGADDVDEQLAGDLGATAFEARVVPDVMRWKWAKLVTNLANTVEALCGREAFGGRLTTLAREEARRCFAAAGIDAATEEEDRARRGDRLSVRSVRGRSRPGSSTWQSLARGARQLEVDWLNGEVVLLGRLHGVATPVNSLLQRLANDVAAAGDLPGGWSEAELLAQLGDA